MIVRGHPSQNLLRAFAVRIQLCELPDLAFDEEPQREFGTRGRRKRGLESWELVWGREGGEWVAWKRRWEGERPSVVEASLRRTLCIPFSIYAEKPREAG